jgi:hypothetical protein
MTHAAPVGAAVDRRIVHARMPGGNIPMTAKLPALTARYSFAGTVRSHATIASTSSSVILA